MVILELLNGVSMDLVTSLCDYSRKKDVKQKNMKYKRLQFSLPSITCRSDNMAGYWPSCCRQIQKKQNRKPKMKGNYGIAENNANAQVTLL